MNHKNMTPLKLLQSTFGRLWLRHKYENNEPWHSLSEGMMTFNMRLYVPWSGGAPSGCRGHVCRGVKRGPCHLCRLLHWSPPVPGHPPSSSRWSWGLCLAVWLLHCLYLQRQTEENTDHTRVKNWTGQWAYETQTCLKSMASKSKPDPIAGILRFCKYIDKHYCSRDWVSSALEEEEQFICYFQPK